MIPSDEAFSGISSRGYWTDLQDNGHAFDRPLADGLAELFRGTSVVDFGCGKGDYVRHFRSLGTHADGYDGNPHTPAMSGGTCTTLDLSRPVRLKQYDWVLSLEVGEHIPAEYEEIFLRNIHCSALKGVVVSWAIVGQDGRGHVNTHDNQYIRDWFVGHGYYTDIETERALRAASTLPWFKNTMMVFRCGLFLRLRKKLLQMGR